MASKGRKHGAGGGGPFEGLRALREELKSQTPSPIASPSPGKRTTGGPRAEPPIQPHADAAEEEALLLHRLFAGVEPLSQTGGHRIARQRVERSAAVERQARRGGGLEPSEADEVHERLRTLVDQEARFEVADDGRRVEGRRIDLPHDALRRLRRGLSPVDARVDLHGMSVSAARDHLEQFLRAMRSRGERCVLVIHGKGTHSPQGLAVLRGEIAAWLSQGPASVHVAAFTTALGDDGGEGAVYVLLRR